MWCTQNLNPVNGLLCLVGLAVSNKSLALPAIWQHWRLPVLDIQWSLVSCVKQKTAVVCIRIALVCFLLTAAAQAALAGAVICLSACVGYCIYSVLFPGLQKRRIDAARRKVGQVWMSVSPIAHQRTPDPQSACRTVVVHMQV